MRPCRHQNKPAVWADGYEELQQLGNSGGIETWLLRERLSGSKLVGKRSHLQQTRLRELAETLERLQDLRWQPGQPFGIAGLREAGDGYLLLDYIPGHPLQSGSAWAPALARLLAAIHARRILHLDLKPQNILLSSDGAPVLIDFGFSQAAPLRSLASLAYSAPEMRGEWEAAPGPPSDFFSIGRILGECLSPAEQGRYSPLLDRLTQPDPLARYQHGEALALDLELLNRGGAQVGGQAVSSETSFVGRESELRQLAQALPAVAQGVTAWTAVGAPSGLGKTRLLEEFAARSGLRVLRGGCYQGSTPRTHRVLQEAFSALSSQDGLCLPLAPARILATVFPALRFLAPVGLEPGLSVGVLHQD